ncbi:hypothetical protein KSP40_PGU013652 [Platanthera guangdongensis]|uniref:Uncharacterized protein n=1 Tax=Platanthera guangdongensis TaxID=2320717 RepID=A0ABR2MBX8_9ASPA
MGRRLLSAAAADDILRHSAAVSAGASASDHVELDEGEVWAAAAFSSGDGGRTWRRQVDLVDCRCHVGGLSKAFEGGSAEAKSAPVAASLPDWPRTGTCRFEPTPAVVGSGKKEEEEEEEWVPPHEYLAREHGRSELATSVLEGAGRTLKGRDMSRVRNAVWSQTGFFG